MQRYVVSKWSKTNVLAKSPKIRPHIPRTAILRKDTLEEMIRQYGMVYVKPDNGTHGKGVFRVERRPVFYQYQAGSSVKTFSTIGKLYAGLSGVTKNRKYLVQKGIDLLKHNGRRFDIRVMVQHNPSGRWEPTAMIGRVAAPRRIVTNFHNGGTLKSVPTLMSPYMSQEEFKGFAAKLKRIGLNVAGRLEARYPGIKEIGLDIAVDSSLKPWILEVNTSPDPYIFRALKDKRVFKRVIRYANAYSRIPAGKK